MKAAALSSARAVWPDYLELCKPRLTFFVLLVVGLGGALSAHGWADWIAVVHAVVGTALVAGGGSAFNMLLEREHDARMARTWDRPLPAGRLRPAEVAWFGAAAAAAGLLLLWFGATPLAAGLAALTAVTYVALYTPLKRVTTLNTHIGAIPGALPALIGFAAVQGELTDVFAWTLFLIVYLWQLPHFLSIAWLYRDDYARAGFRMLPSVDPDGTVTGRQAVLGALALLPVSLLPLAAHAAGPLYALGALLNGAWYVARATGFLRRRTPATARRLLRASLVYLPLQLALLALCG